MIWGLLPIVLLTMNYDSQNIGIIAAIYPTVYFGQLFTGKMSDIFSKKKDVVLGMLMQGIAIFYLFRLPINFISWLAFRHC
jgi:MFS family permease